MSIGKWINWARAHDKELFWAVVIFLVASLSFGLGYLSNRELNHSPIVVEKISSNGGTGEY